MGKKGAEKQWVDYYISMHLGFCHGPVDSLEEVLIKEKAALDTPMSSNGFVDVKKLDLFGGNEREGGIAGRIYFLNGNADQLIPEEYASRLGLTPQTAPGYRGKASLLFIGSSASGQPGFNIGANYPSVPSIWARLRRAPKTLNTINNIIISQDGKRFNANPAHIIHETVVNKRWGMGGLASQLDASSFQNAATTLYDEGFGLSLQWTKQTTVEAFLQEIINHIKGLFFYNPRTGLGTLKLLRNDYDINDLDEIGPDNAVLKSFRRKLWGETTNEIVVSWTNPETEEEETITYQDPGNISMQGQVVSESRNYYAIREATLATWVASRDIVEVSAPLASAKVQVDRRQWSKLPGDVIKLTWPPKNIDTVIMRIMDIDYGTPSQSMITLDLMEDVYGLGHARFIQPPTSEWEDPAQDPNGSDGSSGSTTDMQLQAKWIAIPYPFIARALGESVSDDDYPDIIIGALVTPTPEQTDVHSFYMYGEGTLANGDPTWLSAGEKQTTGQTTLSEAIPAEVSTDILVGNVRGGLGPEVGWLGLLGNDETDDTEMELVMFDVDHENGSWTIARGMLDTIPRAWGAGTTLWFLGSNFNSYDATPRTADNSWDYKLCPRTSLGVMDLDIADIQTTILEARPYMPFRPANVKVDAIPFGLDDHSEDYDPRGWNIVVTWSNRNRKTEDSIFRRWDEAGTTPEDGQTTTLIVTYTDVEGDHEERITGIEGETYSIPLENTGQLLSLKIKAIAERDGLESLQGHEVNVRLYDKGYGSDWGYFFGGWPETVEIGE